MSEQPPQKHIDRAIEESLLSPCRSKRGVMIFREETPIARAHNFRPGIDPCDGSISCKQTCGRRAIHAEQAALIRAGTFAQGAQLLHVKTQDGKLVPSKGPSCLECSKLIYAAGIAFVWLYEANGQNPLWRRYSATEFHDATLDRLILGERP